MLLIAGQTAGPIGLKFFVNTHGRPKSVIGWNFFFSNFFHVQRRAFQLVYYWYAVIQRYFLFQNPSPPPAPPSSKKKIDKLSALFDPWYQTIWLIFLKSANKILNKISGFSYRLKKNKKQVDTQFHLNLIYSYLYSLHRTLDLLFLLNHLVYFYVSIRIKTRCKWIKPS